MKLRVMHSCSIGIILVLVFVFAYGHNSAQGAQSAVQVAGLLDVPTPQNQTVIDAIYWKYDNRVGFNELNQSVFQELDHWLEFRPDGTFKETVWVKSKTTGIGKTIPKGSRPLREATGKYKILGNQGEMVYDNAPKRPVRFHIPSDRMAFWPPDGFNMTNDPKLENSRETNWKLTERVGVRPPEWTNF